MITKHEIRAYQFLRQIGKEFCAKLLGVIPKDILVSTAQELGLWKSNVLVGDEGDTDILADRMIYDRRWDGKSCIEHFEARNTGPGLSESEGRFLAAMKTARLSLFTIRETHPGSHAVLSDRLAETRSGQAQPLLELTDLGLSETGVPGMLLATRVLSADGFNMTSGVSFPFTPEREAAIMSYLRQKEFGYRKRRLDLPENYSLYFYRLRRRFGVEVHYEGDEEE
jgi:hypothetical protein